MYVHAYWSVYNKQMPWALTIVPFVLLCKACTCGLESAVEAYQACMHAALKMYSSLMLAEKPISMAKTLIIDVASLP